MFEICTEEDSNLGQAATEYDGVDVRRVTKAMDWCDPTTVERLIREDAGLPGASAHASLPCTCWSTWQAMSEHKFGEQYSEKLKQRREESQQMLINFIRFAEVIYAAGGEVSFEWPKNCVGWHLEELARMITRFDMYSVVVHGCPLGMTDAAGKPILKQWRFIATSARLAAALEPLQCSHPKEGRRA